MEKLLKFYKTFAYNISLKICFLDSQFDFYPTNVKAVSDEHGEQWHKYISQNGNVVSVQMEGVLNYYCWILT